jgi:small subunit ribosomal protein S6
MALYESVFIARQDISADQAEALTDKYAEIIQNNGGSVAKRESWGLRTLAYRIRKNRKGHYVLLNIVAPSDAVKEMERNMRIDEDVIRYLTIRVDVLEEEPSAILRSRGSRDRDDRRGGRDRDDRRGGRDDDNRGKAEPDTAKAETPADEGDKK